MEKNLTLLEEKAERNLLTLCEEREKLQQDVHRKKHELLQLEKEQKVLEVLDKQVCATKMRPQFHSVILI